MTTVVVWVCIIWYSNTGVLVIDNIASERNCLGVLAQESPRYSGKCIAVRKVKI